MRRTKCYIYSWRDPLGGWYAYLTDLEIEGYRLAGWVVSECVE